MPRVCTVCGHPERPAIDAALVAGEQAIRAIAGQYSVSRQALTRHKAEHLPEALCRAEEAEQVAAADDLLAQVQALRQKADAIFDKAEAAGELKTAIGAIREARECVKLLAELAGRLQTAPTVNLVVSSPAWAELRGIILAAVQPYPPAYGALVEALREHAGE